MTYDVNAEAEQAPTLTVDDPHGSASRRRFGREALVIATLIAAPVLVAGMVVGLVDRPAAGAHADSGANGRVRAEADGDGPGAGLSLPWMLTRLIEYTQHLFMNIPELDVTPAASRRRWHDRPLMAPLEFFLVSRFMIFTLVLGRISAMIVIAPIFGTLALPRQVRAFLAVAMALLVTPVYLDTSLPPVDGSCRLTAS